MIIRIALGISAAALSLSLMRAPAALAQDSMQQDVDFKNGLSRDGGIRNDSISIRKDSISKAALGKSYGRKRNSASK